MIRCEGVRVPTRFMVTMVMIISMAGKEMIDSMEEVGMTCWMVGQEMIAYKVVAASIPIYGALVRGKTSFALMSGRVVRRVRIFFKSEPGYARRIYR